MTPELEQRLRRLEELSKTATATPWRRNSSQNIVQTNHITRDVWYIPRVEADLDLIIESRNALPGLIAALREAVKALELISGENSTYPNEDAYLALSTIETLLKK